MKSIKTKQILINEFYKVWINYFNGKTQYDDSLKTMYLRLRKNGIL